MKSVKFIWVFFAIFGLIFLGVGGIFVIPNLLNNENKIETTGIISEMTSYRDHDGDTHYNVFVTYEVNGEKIESELNGYMSGFYEGKEIEIYYDKNNPIKIGTKGLDAVMLLFPGMGLLFFLIGACGFANCIKKDKMKKRLKDTGEIIYATYVESNYNRNYSVNGRHPYYITCEWQNPMDNKRYLFKSENIWTNPERIIRDRSITTFPVYINMSNMKEYLVDISIITNDIVELR